MEPLFIDEEENRRSAPIVIWSDGSPTKKPSSPSSEVYKTANATPYEPSTRSNGSSGIGKDSPERTPSENTTYSPALSGMSALSVTASNNNVRALKNGDISNNHHSPLLSEGVKFIDSDGHIISVDKDDSICSSGSDDEETVKRSKVPDGGWGWVVVFSSLVVSMIADGISFSFGLLYIEFLEAFGESKAKTAWIGSLFMAVPLLTGPIMSGLVDRYGCRLMTIIGGFISGFGFILAMFGNSVEYELVTFGVIAGLGLGLCYVTAVVSVCFWFEKRRTLATALGACGTGIGTFVYAPMTQYFIEEYSWRGCVLLLAGTFFNMAVCGSLMRDPDWIIENKQASLAGTKSIRNASSCGSISGVDAESQFPGSEEIRNLLKSGQTPEYILTTLATTIADPDKEKNDEVSSPPESRSVVNLPTYVRQSEKVPLEVLQQLSSNKKLFNVILENYPSLLHCRSMSDSGKLNQIAPEPSLPARRVPVTMSVRVKKRKQGQATIQEHQSLENVDSSVAVPLLPASALPAPVIFSQSPDKTQTGAYMRRQFSLKEPHQHYLKNIRVHRNSVMYRGAMLNTARYHLRASSCPNIFRNSMTTIAKESEEKWYAVGLEMLKDMLNFSMFLEFHFLLFSLATILLFTFFIVPYFYITEHMVRNGYVESDGSMILSIIGVLNAFGMVGLGWAGDQPWMNVSKSYAVCLCLCGVCCIFMPIVTKNYVALVIFCCLFGVFFASNYSFTPVIVVELIPLEKFTQAYGLILLCQGIGNLLGPPLAGFLTDITGSWDLAFYFAGGWIIVAGVLVQIMTMTKNRRIWGNELLENDRISVA